MSAVEASGGTLVSGEPHISWKPWAPAEEAASKAALNAIHRFLEVVAFMGAP